MKRDPAIDSLLDLHGSILDQGGGYWIKIEAWSVDVSNAMPHGIRHSLTLHEPYGKRLLGHGVPYEFKDAQQLINDFFADVDRLLAEVRKRWNRL